MNRIIKIIAFIFIVCGFSFKINAQYFENPEKKPTFWDKVYFGGGLGLQFGTVTQIEVSPLIGYKLTKRIQPGIGFTYSYINDKRFTPSIDYSTYGASVFTRFFIFEGLFAHVEAEALNLKVYTLTQTGPSSYTMDSRRDWIQNYYVGGGYFQKIGERSGMYILVLWNLNQSDLSPYQNPVVRVGFNF